MILHALILVLSLLLASPSWAAVAFGTASTQGSGTNSIAAQAYPASIAAGDLLVFCIGHKYPAVPSSPSTPSGWTAPSNNTGRGDDGLGTGTNDQGETQATVFYRIADGTESGTFVLTNTSATSTTGVILRFTNATGQWLVAAANGGDASRGANWSATMGSDPGIEANDMVMACFARSEGSVISAASEAMTASGATFGSETERADFGTSFGDNVGAGASTHAVTAGPASGNVTYTFTSATSSSGGTVILRIREDNAAAPTTIQSNQGFLGVILQ